MSGMERVDLTAKVFGDVYPVLVEHQIERMSISLNADSAKDEASVRCTCGELWVAVRGDWVYDGYEGWIRRRMADHQTLEVARKVENA